MDMYAKAVESLKSAITNAINKAIENGELPKAEIPEFIIETPADTTHGDFATNAALLRQSRQILICQIRFASVLKLPVRDSSTFSSALTFIRALLKKFSQTPKTTESPTLARAKT